MTRGRLNLDPMPALKAAATKAVNEHFNALATANMHRGIAHADKRKAADAGEPYPDWFTAEADLRGLSAPEFAALILSKPDATGQRELQRQTHLLRIDAATVPKDVESAKAAALACS